MADKVELLGVTQEGVKGKQVSIKEELVHADEQNENMLTIKREIDEKETSFEEMKLNLDLDEDAALTSSKGEPSTMNDLFCFE